ncbi:signal peptidase II [Rhodobacteraceae bacterium]|nr:signal peptidase II [Paracoccaceae bacterium]
MRLATGWAAGVLLLDQLSKYLVVHLMQLDRLGRIDVVPPWLNFRMAWNRGVNFGLFAGDANLTRWILIALAVVISVWVWIWIARKPSTPRVQASAGILIGGAMGNVIDRLLYGAVADFINMSLPGWRNPFSFNVADIAIFIGAIGLALFTGDKKPNKKH